MRIARKCGAVIAVLALLLAGRTPVESCPFCSAPSLTLSEQLAQSDASVLVQWVKAEKPEEKKAGFTQYEVREIVRGGKEGLKKGDRITLDRYRTGKPGDLFMLMGTKGAVIEWGSPLEVSEASYNYIAQSPSPELPTKKRLEYFIKFLEYPDQLVSNDAYGEFANAPYGDITQLSDVMPREKLREWITSSETPATRFGLYGLMLGLCGNEDDAQLMEAKIREKTEDFRLGIDGIISGYLLLTGDEGLNTINESKLKNKDVPFSETYAAMQALRFMWTYGDGKIAPERLQASMRILLDRPELSDLVIADLARWKDWSVQDRLMALYGADEYNIPSIKRAIVRYMLVGSKDVPEAEGEAVAELPPHVVKARKMLDKLRKSDPKTVKDAERFFFLK